MRRAYDVGQLDLMQVEGLRDLIDADTESQRCAALRVAGVRAPLAQASRHSRHLRLSTTLVVLMLRLLSKEPPGSVVKVASAYLQGPAFLVT